MAKHPNNRGGSDDTTQEQPSDFPAVQPRDFIVQANVYLHRR